MSAPTIFSKKIMSLIGDSGIWRSARAVWLIVVWLIVVWSTLALGFASLLLPVTLFDGFALGVRRVVESAVCVEALLGRCCILTGRLCIVASRPCYVQL